jgi:manganese transport protein
MIDCTIALNVAFFVNAAILIVSAAVFHTAGTTVTEIAEAHDLLEGMLDSKVAPVLFGLGLVCAGQSSTLTGTLAGQIVMEGFLEMRMVPWLRRLLTRLVALAPAVIVLMVVGDRGTYQLLIFSQVLLSMALPFAVLPLMKFTSSAALMGEFKNPPWVLVVGSLSAAIIVSLNLWFLFQAALDLFYLNRDVFVYSAVLAVPVAASCLALMVYIIVGSEQPLEPNGHNLLGSDTDDARNSGDLELAEFSSRSEVTAE